MSVFVYMTLLRSERICWFSWN